MPNRIRAMIFSFFVGSLLAWLIYVLMGCASGIQLRGQCVNDTNIAMNIAGEKYIVRAVIGDWGQRVGKTMIFGPHAIAQAYRPNPDTGEYEWVTICMDYWGGHADVIECKYEQPFIVERYMTPKEWREKVIKPRQRAQWLN